MESLALKKPWEAFLRLNSGVFSSPGSLNQDNECVRDEKCSHEMFRQEEMSRASLENHSP